MSTRARASSVSLLALAVVGSSSSLRAQFVTQVSTDGRGVSWPEHGFYVGRDGMSSNGRWLVYQNSGVVYRRDLSTGLTELVSADWLTGAGTAGENASVTDDGRWVCFETDWEGNVPGDTNFAFDVFLRDMASGVTSRINQDRFGGQTWGNCFRSVISRDGSTIVYESDDPNIAPGDTNFWRDFFAYDVASGVTELVSADPTGVPGLINHASCASFSAPCQWAGSCSVSGDGRFVAFMTRAYNLIQGGTAPANLNVFVRDRVTQSTVLVSANSLGQEADGPSFVPAISADGRYVAFQSWSYNLAGSGLLDLYVRDTGAGTTHRVAYSANGSLNFGYYRRVSISGDGMWVAYSATASDLVPGDLNGASDAFATEWQSGTTRLLSRSTTGQGSGDGFDPVVISGDGSRTAFLSTFDALVAGPPDDKIDLFLRDERVQSVPVVAYCTAKTNSLGCQPAMSTSGICSFTLGTPFFVTSQFERSHQSAMMVWSTAPAAQPFSGGFVCVQLPMQRTPLQDTGGLSAANDCTGTCSYVFTAQYAQSRGLSPGSTVYAQYWTRDPIGAAVRRVNASDAIAFTWAP